MYIKIYFDSKPLFLCDSIDETIQPFLNNDDAVFIDELSLPAIKTIIYEMQLTKVHAGVYFNGDLDALKKALWKRFTIVQAAGGLVENKKQELLMIFRRGHWDLPKGKLDRNEELEECAIREVQEETGLTKVKLIKPLTTTYHTYHEGTKFILKETYWFYMKVNSNQHLIPQSKEDIDEIRWVKMSDVDMYLQNSYPSIRDVFESFNKK